ncbi:hypothetical protein [Hymenobacter sp. BT491]|uniref:hypothetical protein n=1 Tax=Hymenobacter sp. BT491 TaxID=2766779 RepID=UPI0016535B35|nr:hypothetical protein [Hymenobacter sp. BT491]MBC6988628.1 hypothetical protein [Hymenobacter sp. BT491]
MVKALLFVVGLAFALSGCVNTSPDNSVSRREAIVQTRQEAVKVATLYLKQQPIAGDYFLDSTRVKEEPAEWLVFFKRNVLTWPREGLIVVDKRTGTAYQRPYR